MLFFIDIVIYITSFTREIKFDRDTNALGMLEELNISFISYCTIKSFLLETMNHQNLGWWLFFPSLPSKHFLSFHVRVERKDTINFKKIRSARARLYGKMNMCSRNDVGLRTKDTFSRLKGREPSNRVNSLR